MSVKSKLIEINESGAEKELYPVLKTLFEKLGFSKVQITHGPNEFGKDLIFCEEDKLKNKIWTSAVVKNSNSSQAHFEEGGEIIRQVSTSFKTPFLNQKGKEIYMNKVLVVVNGKVSANAKEILKTQLDGNNFNNVEIWDYQLLGEYISDNIEDEFLGKNDFISNLYKKNQIARLGSLKGKREFYRTLEISEIDDIFVSVKTTLNKLEEEKRDYNYDKQPKSSIRELDDAEAIIKSNKHYLIKGIAASGKSLLLKRIGINALKKNTNIAVGFFELSEIEKRDEDFDINNFIENQFLELTNNEGLNLDGANKLILLFDGLDEVSDEDKKGKIFISILEFLKSVPKSYPNVQVIVSSRNFESIESINGFSSFEEISLLPFDPGQALTLAKKIIPNNKQKAESFVIALGDSQLTNNLVRTPMALTLMAILYRDDEVDLDELPANITELYSKFTDYYLNRWDAEKGISQQYKFEETKNILGLIALEMQKRGINQIDHSEFILLLTNLSKEYPYNDLKNPEELLKSIEERSGVLLFDQNKKVISFIHQSFQEYFASIPIDDSNEEELIDSFFNDWWSNVLIFYSGKNPKRFIFLQKLLNKIVPIDSQQNQYFIVVVSKIIQASHLIKRDEQKIVLKQLINGIEKFYQDLKNEANESLLNPLHLLNTVDFIMRFRDFIYDIFDTKHIDVDDFSEVALNVITDHENYSDVVRYSLSHLLARKTKDGFYLQEFSADENLNVRWSRIIFVDSRKLHVAEHIDPHLYKRIKKRQRNNKKYIQNQILSLASKNLLDD